MRQKLDLGHCFIRRIFFGCLILLALASTSLSLSAQGPAERPARAGKVIDLTHILSGNLPDFHQGDSAFSYQSVYTIKKDGYAGGRFCTPEHYGTHVDAPSHFIEGGDSIDKLAAQKLIAPCVVIDVRQQVKNNPDYELTVDDVKAFEAGGSVPAGAIVLLLTGWSERWQTPSLYRNADSGGTMHFPAFSPQAAAYLVNDRHIGALGLDTISADYGLSKSYGVHKTVLGQGLYIIENLDHLDRLPARGAQIICAPLPLENGTGSPARVLAVVY